MDKKLQEQEFIRPQVEKGKPVFVKDGYELKAICPEEVVCLMANKNYCNIYLKHSLQPVVVSRTYTGLMQTCIGSELLQIHRGTSINIFYIGKIEGEHITMKNGLQLNISQNHVKDFVSMIKIV